MEVEVCKRLRFCVIGGGGFLLLEILDSLGVVISIWGKEVGCLLWLGYNIDVVVGDFYCECGFVRFGVGVLDMNGIIVGGGGENGLFGGRLLNFFNIVFMV